MARTPQRDWIARHSMALGLAGLVVALGVLAVAFVATAAQDPAAAAGTNFVVFGDNRGEKDGRQPAVFRALVKQMAAYRPDFVLATGDYIYGSSSQDVLRAQWDEFFDAMAPLQAQRPTSFAPAVGNHEIHGGDGTKLFLEYFRRLYFSFDRGGSHFVILDTEIPGQESRIAGDQLQWLKQDLQNAGRPYHIFIALHRPLYPVSLHRGDSLDEYPRERDALHALFAQNRVTCVFEGHEHLYNKQVRDGVTYIITGGAGADLYADPAHGGYHHFLYVQADATQYQITLVRAK